MDSMTDFLVGFTNYTDRYYTSTEGKAAMLWLGEQMESTAAAANYANFKMEYFEHAFLQPSPIGRIVGSEFPEQVIIVSAHADSVRNSPGADDDGSGVANYFEVFKVSCMSRHAATSLTPQHGLSLSSRSWYIRHTDTSLTPQHGLSLSSRSWYTSLTRH